MIAITHARILAAHDRAREHGGLTSAGPVLPGWNGRSAGGPVRTPGEGDGWLRVVGAPAELARGSWWTGNVDAESLRGIDRAPLLRHWDWAEGPQRYRAELFQRYPGRVCSPLAELRSPPALDAGWWDALDANLRVLGATPTARQATTPESLNHRTRVFFGRTFEIPESAWETAHGDLHWANLFAPRFGIIDWEAWGTAPAGADIAFLYVHALAQPEVEELMRQRYPQLRATTAGIASLHLAAARVLARAMSGEHAQLVAPVHRLLRELRA